MALHPGLLVGLVTITLVATVIFAVMVVIGPNTSETICWPRRRHIWLYLQGLAWVLRPLLDQPIEDYSTNIPPTYHPLQTLLHSHFCVIKPHPHPVWNLQYTTYCTHKSPLTECCVTISSLLLVLVFPLDRPNKEARVRRCALVEQGRTVRMILNPQSNFHRISLPFL